MKIIVIKIKSGVYRWEIWAKALLLGIDVEPTAKQAYKTASSKLRLWLSK